MDRVSVIMPCFNHAKFLSDSVQAVLRQSHQDLELIIVDDCSKDDSWETIERLVRTDSRIRGIRHEQNQGPSRSRNDGLKSAQGDYLAFCDADDIWECQKLESQLALLRENPDYGVAYCDAVIIDENGASTGQRFSDLFPPPPRPSGRLFFELLKTNFINMASVLLHTRCAQRVGCFDDRVRNVEDWWFWIQLSREYPFGYTPEPLAKYRVHSQSTNRVNRRGYAINRFKVYKRIFHNFRDLPQPQKAESLFGMGAELCAVGRPIMGRRLLWKAAMWSWFDVRCFNTLCKALRRLALSQRTSGIRDSGRGSGHNR